MDWDQAIGVYTTVAASTAGLPHFYVDLASDASDAGKSYYFKISAINTIGQSAQSDPHLVVAATVPDAPSLLLRNEAFTTKTVLSFTWSEGASDGGSPIIDYSILFD